MKLWIFALIVLLFVVCLGLYKVEQSAQEFWKVHLSRMEVGK